MEGRHSPTVKRVETGLGASLGRAKEDVEESNIARSCGAVEGVLVCAILDIDLKLEQNACGHLRLRHGR